MVFKGFPKEGIEFLNKIIINNSKEWLDANREEYERVIVGPNKAYIQEMGEHLQILVPTVKAIPKINKSLFKIYRDSRFHPTDPIKTKIGVILWQGAGHRMQSSSFYMHYEPQEIFVATGIRNFKPTLLSTYREYIQNDERRSELQSILDSLRAKGYSLPEAKYKRMPRDCDATDTNSHLYLMSSLYAYKTFKPNQTFHSEKIIDHNFKIHEETLPLHQWLYELTLHCDTEADTFR